MPTPRPTGGGVPLGPVAVDNSGNITGATSIDIGGTDTTVTRDSAGVLAVEGVKVMRGTSGASDNALIRSDGTSGSRVQDSAITVGDTTVGVAEVTGARMVRGVGTVSSPETQTVADEIREFSGNVTINLLTSCTMGRDFLYNCTSAGTLTLVPNGSDTVNGGAGGASLAISCAAGQAVRVYRSGASAWRAVLPLTPSGVKAYLSDGAWYAQAIAVDASGAAVNIGAPVAMTAEGTSYSEGLSGTTLTLTGPLVGNTGAIQSNSRRWYVALSSLGITLSTTNRRWANLYGLCSSITDNGEVRAGTADLGCYLGVGSTTALCGASVYRPSSGTAYGVDHFQTSATAFTNIGTNASMRGFLARHAWPSDSESLTTNMLSATGASLASTTSSGIPISASTPTHFVVYLRSGASASGAVFSNPIFAAFFGPQVAAL